MNVVAVVQARVGSTRVPQKVLLPLDDKPILQHSLERLQEARTVHEVRVATTARPQDDPIVEAASSLGVSVTRGPENDVLTRYELAAQESNADVVVRVTADCPLLAPEVVDRAVGLIARGEFDYVSNTREREFPRGLDVEVMLRETLERAARNARAPEEREHVTPYIWTRPHDFRIGAVRAEPGERGPEHRMTLDEPHDYGMICAVFQLLPRRDYSARTLVRVLRSHPWLAEINRAVAQKPILRKPATRESFQSHLYAARQCLEHGLLKAAQLLVDEAKRIAIDNPTGVGNDAFAELQPLEAALRGFE